MVVLTLALCSCHSSAATLPASTPIISIDMTEFTFTYSHMVPSGQVIFLLSNRGHFTHQPELFPLSNNIPPIRQQVLGNNRLTVTPFAGVQPVAPGAIGRFAVDLQPGQRYGFVDFARTPDGRSEASLGMATEFRTPG